MVSATVTRAALLADLHTSLEQMAQGEGIVLRPQVVLVDVDGTVADNTWRSPFDWDKVGLDFPITPVIKVVQALREQGNLIIFVSGRKEQCRLDTLRWLRRYVVSGHPAKYLFMRQDDDNRPDIETKSEIYETCIKGRFNVLLVIDDRASVVKMWRDKGLTVLQCAEGNF